jgi:hypothetical protein
MACLFEVSSAKAESTTGTSDFSWRNWVNVDVVYLGSNSITLKLAFEILGNTLHNNTDIVISTVKSGQDYTVQTNAVALKAWYSSDTNMTSYEYTLSSQDVDIKRTGNFPKDSWVITAHILTQFPVLFNDNTEISTTPSQNYFCQYYVSDSLNATEDHNLFINIQHPSSFAGFIYVTYLLPFGLLVALMIFLGIILYINREKIEKIEDNLLIVSIGSIVFIPIYQLPLSSLKIPFLITPFDYLFSGLFVAYFVFIIILLTLKQTKKLKAVEDTNSLNMAKKPILTMTRDEGLVIIGVAIGFLVQICYDVSREFTAFVFQGVPTEIYWLITQGVLAGLFGILGYVVLRRITKK